MGPLFRITSIVAAAFLTACASSESEHLAETPSDTPTTPAPAATRKSLFVASGSCYAGGVTTSTGSGTVVAFDLANGSLEKVLIDYNSFSPGDMPVGLAEYDADHILVLIENTAGRRIDLIRKDGTAGSTFLTNGTALNGIVRSLLKLTDGSYLVSKSTAVEKFAPSKARVTQGANPYISAPAGACATSTALMSSIQQLGNGKFIFTHAAATPNNRIGMIASTGYAVAGDCLTAQAAPTTTALPSASLYHSSGKLLVAYGSTTLASNFIYAYDVNETTNAITGATPAWTDNAFVNGPSAMTEDRDTGAVYVANGNAAFNSIEAFGFDPTTKTMSKSGTLPFTPVSIYTRCVSAMKVMSSQ